MRLAKLILCGLILLSVNPSYVRLSGQPTILFNPLPGTIIHVRRDTSSGPPAESVHSLGLSSIVWGQTVPGARLIFTLQRDQEVLAVREATASYDGRFAVSLDRTIQDKDRIIITNGSAQEVIVVPLMTYVVDTRERVVRGKAPPNIQSTEAGAPHTLQIAIGGLQRQVTTDHDGNFMAEFRHLPYLAGLVGAMHYITPQGHHIYKPLVAREPLARGKAGDWWADVILGQRNFSEIVFNEVDGEHLFNPQGVWVDRSTQPNRLYVYDAGNNRVLGMLLTGECHAGPNKGKLCSLGSDCPHSYCDLKPSANVVLGQPSFTTSTCNGDSGYQHYPDVPLANAGTLCGLREEQMSILEGGSGVTMATDPQGNLYVPDFFNNRVLRYNDPFTTDQLADYVWGQEDFAGIFCNRGAGYGQPSAKSLCLAPPPQSGELRAGVAVDSHGNLWVADAQNHRVLRFPQQPDGIPAREADLVLGQPNFMTAEPGSALNQMNTPTSIQVTEEDTVYVADSLNHRVLVFIPPFQNGMWAHRTLPGDLQRPSGLALDPTGGLWVNDSDNQRFIHYVNEKPKEIISPTGNEGGLGIDQNGFIFSAGWDTQAITRHLPPPFHNSSKIMFGSPGNGLGNATTGRSFYGGQGLEIAGHQLVYGDLGRLLFWNNVWSLRTNQPADGIIGAPNFETRAWDSPQFHRMRADRRGRLWVIRSSPLAVYLLAYRLPLTHQATPAVILTSPIQVLGGGQLHWSEGLALGGIDIQDECDCVWLTDRNYHRAFRIRDASTRPVVDIVLGQINLEGKECNQGRGESMPSASSLCYPGALAFDQAGNLYIADHNLEGEGNLRLLEWDAQTLPRTPQSVVFGIPATRVFARNGNFNQPYCLDIWANPLCAPWEPAFDSSGYTVIGLNGYHSLRFPLVYENLLSFPYPIAVLGDFHSMPVSARFDSLGNLYVADHNRSRILIYWRHNRQWLFRLKPLSADLP